MPRQPNGYPKISPADAAGYYHCYVTVGRKPDGRLDRRHIKRRTMEAVAEAVDELKRRMRTGAPIPIKVDTAGAWLLHWVDNIVKPKREYKTWAGYRSLLTVHVIPAIGHWRLAGTRTVLEPEHVEALYARMAAAGLAPSYVLQCHRILSRALKDAVRRGKASRNVCDLIDPPAARQGRVKAHTLDEAQRIITAALDDEYAARWYLGLMYGLRQGEALGLRWTQLDLVAGQPTLLVDSQLQRQTYVHGCTNPAACAAAVCARRKTCPPSGCARHQRACPPPHAPGCTEHARQCPKRIGGLVDKAVKSEKGERVIALDTNAVDLLTAGRERQQRDLAVWGVDWHRRLHVFTTDEGTPIDPGADHDRWESLLVRANVADSRLHAARHTAGTLMLATGTDIRVIQEVLGHSRITVTERYVDVADQIKREAVDRVAAALFSGELAALLQPSAAPKKAPG